MGILGRQFSFEIFLLDLFLLLLARSMCRVRRYIHGMPVVELLDPPGAGVTVSCDPPHLHSHHVGAKNPTSGPLREEQVLFIFFLMFKF